MLILAAAAAAGSTPPPSVRSPAAAMVEARATVRILSGVRLHLDKGPARDGFVRRDTVLRSPGGSQPARLVEFE